MAPTSFAAWARARWPGPRLDEVSGGAGVENDPRMGAEGADGLESAQDVRIVLNMNAKSVGAGADEILDE